MQIILHDRTDHPRPKCDFILLYGRDTIHELGGFYIVPQLRKSTAFFPFALTYHSVLMYLDSPTNVIELVQQLWTSFAKNMFAIIHNLLTTFYNSHSI